MPRHTISVNGERHDVDVDDDMPLLWIIRDVIGLTGTKFGCGMGICGACAVLRDGAAVRSCQITANEANGKRFTTIEGLSKDNSHPCQRAWLEEDVAQCGYCQAGMILTACALLRAHPHPTDAQIDDAMSDLICRCGTYPRIRKAIRKAVRS
jgi:aerobic-type carbon monoxide dehydrogenase small subunit (CoxS/CutS family)